MVKVAIVECKEYKNDEVRSAVSKALDIIGFSIKPSSTVLIKPNVLRSVTPEKAVTTHPAVIDAVCTLLERYNCKLIIGESCGVPERGVSFYERCGIAAVARAHGAKLISFSSEKLKEVFNDRAVFEKSMLLPEILFDVDLVINIPKLKTHTLMLYTGAVKNLFGCVPGGKKQAYHAAARTKEQFAHLLLDIWQNIKPQLNIMDGVVGMEGNGPSNGNSINSGIIMASTDAIALDIAAARIIGFEGKVLTNLLAIERGLIKDVEIEGVAPELKFKQPLVHSFIPDRVAGFFLKKTIAYPRLRKDACKKCMVCVSSCPVQAMNATPPSCNERKCIACYCCYELCPHNAIELKQSLVFEKAVKAYYFMLNMLKRR